MKPSRFDSPWFCLPLEHASEYDSAAEWCARRGLSGAIGTRLPEAMETYGALQYIQADPEAFEQRVRDFAYEIAMGKTES